MRGARSARTFDDEAAKLRGLERDRAAVLAKDPAREQQRGRVLGDEDVVLDLVSLAAEGALHPPRRVGRNLDAGVPDDVAELPFGAATVVLDVELGRKAEVALTPRCEADVGPNT